MIKVGSRRARQDGAVAPVDDPTRIPEVSVDAVVRLDRVRARRARPSTPGWRPTPTSTRLLAEVELDAVLIATPTRLHAPMVRTALERGLHVFCEKPLTPDRRRVGRAGRAGAEHAAGHPGRLSQPLRRRVPRGEAPARRSARSARSPTCWPRRTVRSCSRPRARPGAASGPRAAAACTTTPRIPLDLLSWYVGAPRGVGGTMLGSVFSAETEDEVFGTLYYPDGSSGQISVNWSDESLSQDDHQDHDRGAPRAGSRRPPGDPGLPARHAPIPTGYQTGWNVRYTTELTEPVGFYLRGEEYSAQLDHFVRRIEDRRRWRASTPSPAPRSPTGCSSCSTIDAGGTARRRSTTPTAAVAPRVPTRRSPTGGGAHDRRRKEHRMDRLLFGDNQFFGVNHMSEEKARAQAMRFQDLDAVIDGARRRVRRGHHDLHVHDARPDREDRRPRPRRTRSGTRTSRSIPCMPYAHKYADAMTEAGMLGAVRRFLPEEGLVNAARARRTLGRPQGRRGHHHACSSTPRWRCSVGCRRP